MSTLVQGKRAEQEAATYLQSLGYQLITRNFHCRYGEIDIVAQEKDTLCFVEVRSRRSLRFGRPEESITYRKQQRLRAAALIYLSQHPSNLPCRFDVVAVTLAETESQRIRLIRGAFE